MLKCNDNGDKEKCANAYNKGKGKPRQQNPLKINNNGNIKVQQSE